MALKNVSKAQMSTNSVGYDYEVVRGPLVVLVAKFKAKATDAPVEASFYDETKLELDNMSVNDNPFASAAISKLFTVSTGTAALSTSALTVGDDVYVPLWMGTALTSFSGFSKTANTSETQTLDGSETATVTRDSTSWEVTMSAANHNQTMPYYVADAQVNNPLALHTTTVTTKRIADMLYEKDVTAVIYYRPDGSSATSISNPLEYGAVKVTTTPASTAEAGTTGLQTNDYTFTGQDDVKIAYAPLA